MYFSTKNIPELEKLPIKERAIVINNATLKLNAAEKFVLNVLKLIMLIPPFLFLAQQNGSFFAVALSITIVIYFFVFTPIKLHYMCKYIPKKP